MEDRRGVPHDLRVLQRELRPVASQPTDWDAFVTGLRVDEVRAVHAILRAARQSPRGISTEALARQLGFGPSMLPDVLNRVGAAWAHVSSERNPFGGTWDREEGRVMHPVRPDVVEALWHRISALDSGA